MKPIDPAGVEGRHVVIAEHQPEYIPLPACVRDDVVHTRWRFSLRERIAVLFGRSIDLELLTFKRPLQPLLLYVQGMAPRIEDD